MTVEIVSRLLEIAKQEGDAADAKERCGVIIKKGNKAEVVELPNSHPKPTHFFSIETSLLQPFVVAGNLIAMWHTHPNGSASPSMADRKMIEAWNLPCHIVSYPEMGHSYTVPNGYETPLEGRPFVHATLDCYSLIRDWFWREKKIALDDFERQDEWWEKGDDLYRQHFASQGFFVVEEGEEMRRGDVILMQVGGSPVTNHGSVFLGDDRILHHLYNRLSEVAIYGGYWAKCTTLHLRHEKLK